MSKNIAFIIPSLGVGGAEHQTVNQINYLVESGYSNIWLIVLSNVYPLLEELKLEKDRVLLIPESNSTIVDALFFKSLPVVVSRLTGFIEKYQITDVLAIMPMAHFACRVAKLIQLCSFKRRFKLNVYYRALNYETAPLDTFSKKIFNKISSGLAFLFDNKSLFISQAVYSNISANIFTRHPLVLPNSLSWRNVSADLGENFIAESPFFNGKEFLILIPGRFHPVKGHTLFIKAFHKVVSTLNLSSGQIKVIFAGDGPEYERITSLIVELNLKDYFFLNGYTNNTLLLSLYKKVNLVVIPSFSEGFGNVAIEGLMQQSLMLASTAGGLKEIIRNGENGFLFEAGNENDLVEKLEYLFLNKDKELIDKGLLLKEFLANYTVDSQVDKIFTFCDLY
ncbi:glycosyltransferase [Rufibacter quisquiliarum]|uniref:Glycosyltransferase involved in cell wall biosynthesis n=1 Tax=Rufibacter quisquiliarum TaxID=1549639 RepID=A0A839GDJ1_9BACT|nr:glycosyltransferase [Rufibacter quisquiliarum]MBA9076982.1 glycosyltransferase involved in cell wall biosynthesis [Rufibacter quisquiliarum]